MNKKADWFEIAIVGLMIFSFFFLIFLINYKTEDYKTTHTELCEKECRRFDYSFYKFDFGSFFESDGCWCLDDNKPVNIGEVKEEK